MSDRASLLRLLRELRAEKRTEKADEITNVIVGLFDEVREELYNENDRLEAENTRLRSELEGSETSKNNAYAERDKLVAALSKMFPSSLERHPETEAWEDDWRWIVFIDLPTGQATWHIHDSELPMFDHLRRISGRRWDGHTTEEKYRRIAALESEKAQLRSKLDAAMAFVPTDAWGNGVNPTLTTASNPVDTTKYQKDGDK